MPADILIVPNRNSTTLNPNIQFSGSAVNTIRLEAQPSGSVAFVGNSGSLFSVVDSMSGSLMAVSDVSGLPILEVFSDDRVVMGKYNSNALVVTGSRVGIGKTAPTTALEVSGSSIISGSLTTSGSAYVIGDGKIVLGSATPDTVLSAAGDVFQLLSTSATFGFIARYSNNANGARFGFFKSRATTIGGRAAVQAGDNLGRLAWFADNGGSTGIEAATIYAENVAGDPVRSRLIFAPGWTTIGLKTAMVVDESGAQITGSTYTTGNVGIAKGFANAPLDVNGNAIVTGSLVTTSTINGLTLRNIATRNIGVGESIVPTTVTGYDNVAFGYGALSALTSGQSNVAVGSFCASAITTGTYNVAVGTSNMINTTTGGANTSIGYYALYNNVGGGQNVAVGYQAGRSVAGSGGTGYNVLVGSSAGYSLTTAEDCVIIGFNGGYDVTTGGGNTLIGRWTGQGITTGTNNTVIGSSLNVGNVSNTIAIGSNSSIRLYIDSSGNMALGKTSNINAKLDVNGNTIVTGSLAVTGIVYDSSMSAGTSGQVLSSTGTGTSWVASGTGTTPDFSPIFLLMGA